MKFVGVREFRTGTARIWSDLKKDREMVITSNGKPVALLTAVQEDNFDETLRALRRARAMEAVEFLHRTAVRSGLDRLSATDIENEIRQVRRSL